MDWLFSATGISATVKVPKIGLIINSLVIIGECLVLYNYLNQLKYIVNDAGSAKLDQHDEEKASTHITYSTISGLRTMI
jgi:hypothetical protein